MKQTEELELFLQKADDLLQSKYVLADIKIINLLKAIASSETILNVIKSSLDNFDYQKEKLNILRPSTYMEDKGEVVLPEDAKTVIAFVFNLLLEIDGKKVDLNAFMQKYFFEGGSYYESYASFMTKVILPFKTAIKTVMERLISGEMETPFEEKKEEVVAEKKDFTTYKEEIKYLLEKDLNRLQKRRLGKVEKVEVKVIIDAFIASLELDVEGIKYAYYAYKYAALYQDIGFNYKKITKILKKEEII